MVESVAAMPKQKQPLVLDEDEWTERIEAIIERDYFPDIPKMQNKLEWLQAVRSRNPDLLRQAQLNIAQRRAGLRTPIGASPATFETPGLTGLHMPASLLRTPAVAQTPRIGEDEPVAREDAPVASTSTAATAVEGVSLDKYMAQHTSEDNASFNEIVEASNKRRRLAKPWLFVDKDEFPKLTAEEERPVDGFGTTGQPQHKLLTWPYTNKNTLYYDSSQQKSVALTNAEKAMQVQGPPKQINRTGTRFAPPKATDRGATPASEEPDQAPSSAAGPEYSVLATPSFTPGVEESPFITWGDVEGTPLRLDAEDDIVINPADASGPQFRVPEASARDALGRSLGQTAAAKLRQRAASARRSGAPLTPGTRMPPLPPPSTITRRNGDGTPMRVPLSTAGRKLAQSLLSSGKAAGATAADAQLRASYSGTPGSRPSAAGGATPLLPSDVRRSVTPIPARSAATPATSRSIGSLTDDLLKI